MHKELTLHRLAQHHPPPTGYHVLTWVPAVFSKRLSYYLTIDLSGTHKAIVKSMPNLLPKITPHLLLKGLTSLKQSDNHILTSVIAQFQNRSPFQSTQFGRDIDE